MNFRELEYLIAIDEEGHFGKAAERCFVSQPTLSGQLKKLEDELGVMLVERTKRQVKMTDVGQAVANQARRVIAESKTLKEMAKSFHDPMLGELHVGLIPTVAPYLLPLVMPALKEQCPKLKLWLHEYQTHILLKKLRNAELDFLILALPVETNEFEEIDLYDEAFRLAVPLSEDLSNKTQISLLDLKDKNLLLLEEGHCLRGQALDVCFSAGASEYSDFQATSLETLRYMVAESMGMTLMPELSIPRRPRKDEAICYIQFSDPQPSRHIGILYRKESYRQVAFQLIAKVITESIIDHKKKYLT